MKQKNNNPNHAMHLVPSGESQTNAISMKLYAMQKRLMGSIGQENAVEEVDIPYNMNERYYGLIHAVESKAV